MKLTDSLSTAENDEDLVEYCIATLENLLTNCVRNLFGIIEEQQYNCIIDAVQTFLFILTSRKRGDEGIRSSAYSAPVIGFAVGRPRPYKITFDQLSFLVGEDFSTRRIANCLGVSVSTVRRRQLRDIFWHRSYSAISDTDFDQLIRNIRSHFPRRGWRQMRAMLEADHGLRIQRCRVRMAMRRVDPAGAAIRCSEVHVRRRYNVYGANALWHIDTHPGIHITL